MKERKIIYTGAFRFPNGDAAAQRVLNNAKISRELGYTVEFVSWGGKPQESDREEDGYYYCQGFRYINMNDIDTKQTNLLKRIYNHFFAGKRSLQIIKQTINTVDMVIGYNPSMYFTNQMLTLCKKNNIPFVSDITEWYDNNEFPGGKYSPASWINDLNMRFTQNKVKNKIVISSFLDKYYKASNNIILPPLVDCEETKWRDLNSNLVHSDGIRILYAGSPAKKDLLGIMIDAVISCLNAGLKLQFVIVGISKENISKYTTNEEVLSFPSNIIFCGRVQQKEVPSYYNASDFSIIIREPTRKNMAGFPTKLVETMMAGCPVILNYTSDLSCYIKNGINGFIMKDWSSDELKKILKKVSDLPQEEILKMKSNAYKTALESFDYRKYLNQTSHFLQKLEK